MQKAVLAKLGDYEIRRCDREDIPSVIEVNMKTLPEHYSDYFYYEILSEFPETFLVAELHDVLVGYIMCRIEYGFSQLKRLGLARKGHVVSVAVEEEHRGKGIDKWTKKHDLHFDASPHKQRIQRQSSGVSGVYFNNCMKNIYSIAQRHAAPRRRAAAPPTIFFAPLTPLLHFRGT